LRLLNVEPARYDDAARAVLAELGSVEYVECSDQHAFLGALGARPYDVVLVRLGLVVDARALESAPALKWIVTPTTGLDHIDVAAAEQRAVEIISLQGETAFLESIRSTAEHTWGLLLSLLRRIPAAHADVLAGHWRREPFLGEELNGKSLGIIGCGRLGRMVARYGLAFGMRVHAYDHDPANVRAAPAGTTPASLDELLATSDVVSLHLPLTAETRGFLSRKRIALMKSGAVLINTARGELVDEQALLDALRDERLSGAALDVLGGEAEWAARGGGSHPVIEFGRDHPTLLITPHIGGYGRQSITSTRMFVARKLARAVAADASTRKGVVTTSHQTR
jgi:D-3-phosphoglycerate dehydrogenase